MPLPIGEAHVNIIQTIPPHKTALIDELEKFIIITKNRKTDQNLYSQYLRVLLKHMPQRPLVNKDPDWMWNCQEAFSNSFNQ